MQQNSAKFNLLLGGHDADADDSEMEDADEELNDTPVKEGIL